MFKSRKSKAALVFTLSWGFVLNCLHFNYNMKMD